MLSFLECQQDPLQSFRISEIEWFRFWNTLNCFDGVWVWSSPLRLSLTSPLAPLSSWNRFAEELYPLPCSFALLGSLALMSYIALGFLGLALLQIGLERHSFPEANCFLRVSRNVAPFFEVRITSLALTREIIPFFEVQKTSRAFPRETIPFLKAKHLNALNSPAPPSLK